MKRSLSTLLTTLMFSAAMVPNAMAQRQKTTLPVGLSISAAATPEHPTPDATEPPAAKTEVLPAVPISPVPNRNAISSERSRSSVDGVYPGYCPALPIGTQPGDWDYREALERCLYGS